MVRPLDNQEHLRVNEYANRVKPLKSTDRGTPRDFSIEFHDAVEEAPPDRHHDHELGPDTYEASTDEEREQREAAAEKARKLKEKSAEQDNQDGPLDLTV